MKERGRGRKGETKMKEERKSDTKEKVAMKTVEETEGIRKINLMMETEIRKTGRRMRCRRRER